MSKKEIAKAGGLITVGTLGPTYMTFAEIKTYAELTTIILSLIGILIPTTIWAWARAIHSIRKLREKQDVE